MPCPPAPQPLPKHVDHNRQEGQEEGRAAKDVHDLLRPMPGYPIVGEVREAVEHEILNVCQLSMQSYVN